MTSCGRGQGEVSYLAVDDVARAGVPVRKFGGSPLQRLAAAAPSLSGAVQFLLCCGVVRARRRWRATFRRVGVPGDVSPSLSFSLSLQLNPRPRRTDVTAQKAKVVPCALRSAYPDGSPRSVGAAGATCVGGVGAWVWLVGVLGRLKAPFPLPTCPPYSDCFIALIYKTTNIETRDESKQTERCSLLLSSELALSSPTTAG